MTAELSMDELRDRFAKLATEGLDQADEPARRSLALRAQALALELDADKIDARAELARMRTAAAAELDQAEAAATAARASTGAMRRSPPLALPAAPGIWTLCVASKTTGQPNSRMITSDRMSATRLL